MNDIIMWVIIGVVAVAVLAFVIYWVVKLTRMTPEERKETLLNWLKGAVVAAEEYIGSGHGEEKLKYVEDYFNKKAPWFLKILLAIMGKDSLQDLIEEALNAIESSFGKNKAVSTETQSGEVAKEE